MVRRFSNFKGFGCSKKEMHYNLNIHKETGILMDSPSNGGNTNCGPLASRFFNERNRSVICELIPDEEDKDNNAQLLGDINAFLTVRHFVKRNI